MTVIKKVDKDYYCKGCDDVTYAVLFEIDVYRNNSGGQPEIKDNGQYHYRLFDSDDDGENFAFDDEIQELKYQDGVLYAVTEDYYYIFKANL